MTPKKGKPYFWVSWLSKMLAGETQCVYSILVKSRFWYDKKPSDFEVAKWAAAHDKLVKERVAALKKDGHSVTVERENKFSVDGESAVLAGQMDLIAVKNDLVLVSDGKTGQQRKSDWWQVLIYMACLPLAFPKFKGKAVSGEVAYTGGLVPVPTTDLTTERRGEIFSTLRHYAQWNGPFPTTPSRDECAWCDIAECPDRWQEVELPAVTSEF